MSEELTIFYFAAIAMSFFPTVLHLSGARPLFLLLVFGTLERLSTAVAAFDRLFVKRFPPLCV